MKCYYAAVLFSLLILLSSTAVGFAQTVDWAKVFPDGLLTGQQEPVSLGALQGKFVGVYFSAGWCRGCRQFTPKLITFHERFGGEFEVILCGFDKTAADHVAYMQEYQMPWLTTTFQAEAITTLKTLLEASEIPFLAVFSPEGKLVSKTGWEDVTFTPDSCLESWKQVAAGGVPNAE